MVLPSFLTFLFFTVLLTDFLRIRGAAEATSLHGRKAQANGCGVAQCFSPTYGLCFHLTSHECLNLSQPQPEVLVVTPSPTPMPVVLTPSPTPRPVVRMVETENPILIRLNNVADNYILSVSYLERILNKIGALLAETLDESWEFITVEYPGKYIGERRLQPSLRGGNKRRLNKTIFIPAVVIVRGREDMSDMSRLFILQALRDRLDVLSMYLKSSIDANAFRSVLLSVEELNLADIDIGGSTNASPPETSVEVTSTGTGTVGTGADGTGTDGTLSSGTPSWVWIIVALACLAVVICLLCCISRAGPCISCDCGGCLARRKPYTNEDHEMRNQLALAKSTYHARVPHYDYGKYDGGRHVVYKRRRGSTRVRRHGERRRRAIGRERRHGDWRRTDYLNYGKRRRHDESRNHQSQSDCSSRPAVKRSHRMIEKELSRDEIDIMTDNGPLSEQDAAHALALYQNALVVRDDVKKRRFALEPEGSMIDDIADPQTTALVLYNPPKEPEGEPAEMPRRMSLPLVM
jgi:hypothetical protein